MGGFSSSKTSKCTYLNSARVENSFARIEGTTIALFGRVMKSRLYQRGACQVAVEQMYSLVANFTLQANFTPNYGTV